MGVITDRRAANRALAYIGRYPWAIQPDWLELITDIAARGHDADLEAVAARQGERLERAAGVQMRDDVAVMEITGPIFRYANLFTEISGATSIESLARDFRAALESSDVSGIVLAIDSPGGQTNGVQEFADMVYDARGRKPVVAYVNELGASAAYFIAAAAERVVMAPMASVGSIGVVASVRTDKEKNTIEVVSSQSPGKRPDTGSLKGLSQLQEYVDALADVFIESVAKYRGVDSSVVLERYGKGGVLVGRRALAAGMADELGSLEAVIAGLSGTSRGAFTMSESKIKAPEITRELIANESPAIADAFRREGAAAERERVQSVRAVSLSGHEELIERLAFDGKTTGAEAAVAVLQAERDARKDKLTALREDGARAVAPVVAAPVEPAAAVALLPLDARCKQEWETNGKLHEEFADFDSYLAFMRASAAGRVRRLTRKAD